MILSCTETPGRVGRRPTVCSFSARAASTSFSPRKTYKTYVRETLRAKLFDLDISQIFAGHQNAKSRKGRAASANHRRVRSIRGRVERNKLSLRRAGRRRTCVFASSYSLVAPRRLKLKTSATPRFNLLLFFSIAKRTSRKSMLAPARACKAFRCARRCPTEARASTALGGT